jgi:hypothetical protein
MTQVELTGVPLDRLPADAAAALFYSDELPPCGGAALLDWRLDGRLTRLLQQGRLDGNFGEHLLVRSNRKVEATWSLFVGGGRRLDLEADRLRWLLRHLLETCQRTGFMRVALGLDCPVGFSSTALAALVGGVLDDLAAGGMECRLALPFVAGEKRLP